MSLPSHGGPSGGGKIQPSIRSFFQPKQPSNSTPPSLSPAPSTRPPVQQQPPPQPQLPLNAPAAPPLPPQPSVNGKPTTTQISASAVAAPAAILPTHHPNITISPILPQHVSTLRNITARLLPVRYPDSFYAALSDPQSSGAFSRVLLWTDTSTSKPTVIGGLVCRPERTFQARPGSAVDLVPDALYVQSLVLNEPYRHLGLAGALLDAVCQAAGGDRTWHCRTVCAHVWTENQEGMAWYNAQGFQRVEPVVVGYYRQLSPNDAWIVKKDIVVKSQSGQHNGVVLQALGMVHNSTTEIPGVAPPPLAPTTTTPNPSMKPSSSPSPVPSLGVSYQNTRPDMEWNDLPAEMSRHLTVPGSGASSGASSRSSSSARKKKERAYPAAAFGK